jgi:hypothetical protein
VLLLIAGSAAFWLLVGLPARWLGGGDAALVFSGAAVLLCLPPMAFSLAWAAWAQGEGRSPHDLLVMVLGATGLRMAFVLLGGLALFLWVPYFQGQIAFWAWVMVVYPVALALDVALTLAGRPAAKARPAGGAGRVG